MALRIRKLIKMYDIILKIYNIKIKIKNKEDWEWIVQVDEFE